MQTILLVIHILVALALVGTILLQRSEGGALGIGGGGGGGGLISGRGAANLLTRTTAGLAIVFFVTSIILSILAGRGTTPPSILEETPAPPAPTQPAEPSGPAVPLSQ